MSFMFDLCYEFQKLIINGNYNLKDLNFKHKNTSYMTLKLAIKVEVVCPIFFMT